ncbi:hypothetical protein [Roseibacillus ishigakijimensis]|uniref:Beta-barrel assembly machine subunit BamF n=1 Tax=Roseibacillus ishigakijimensis TaxID=454146 RepID=A0A934RVM4_9BACT|nr:hypothetical protein [Roseibacillus ishigakijimensis]MBK1834990.1 hypothetical protein [Roseibacillus ishigakijimensis]
MKLYPQLLTSLGLLLALSSCSSMKSGLSKVQKATGKTLQTAKSKIFAEEEPGMALTKADPSRFLPEGTSVSEVGRKKASRFFFAKNDRNQAEDLPPLELPPLPAASGATGDGEFMGILPALDDSGEAAFIDVAGEAPELPPLPVEPELEQQADHPAEEPA